MSRIAKNPVTIPSGVDIKFDGNNMTVKGSKGQLSHNIHPAVELDITDNVISFKWDKKIIRRLLMQVLREQS